MINHFKKILKANYGYYAKRFVLDELIFAVTYKCNFRCRTCYYGRAMDNQANCPGKELSLDEINKVSLSLGNFSHLLISGGEPFLRDDLPEICGIFARQNKIIDIHIPTNGYYTEKIYDYTRKILKQCPQAYLNLSFSLDGLEETHDKIKGVKGSFKQTIGSIRNLTVLKNEFKRLNISVISVVNSLNLNEIIELTEFIKNNLPIDGYGPSPLRGVAYDQTLLAPSYQEWEELSKKLLEYKFLANQKVKYIYNLYTQILKGDRLPFRCQAGNLVGVLEPDGEVKLCELTKNIGNVRLAGYDFKKVWFSEKAAAMRRKIHDCACPHACFIGPSIELHIPALINLYFTKWKE